MPSLHMSACHKRQLHALLCVANAADTRYDAKETTTTKAEDPEKLGLLGKVEALNRSISTPRRHTHVLPSGQCNP